MNKIEKNLPDIYITQIERIKRGQKALNLIRPAKPGDGILKIESDEEQQLTGLYNSSVKSGRIMKFVPASGAATRMSKRLLAISQKVKTGEELKKLVDTRDEDASYAYEFINGLEKFAFYEELKSILNKKGKTPPEMLEENRFYELFEYILTEKGLNLSQLPKGLLQFHSYRDEKRTALEEHILEAIKVFADYEGRVRMHCTIPKKYDAEFQALVELMEKKYADYKIEVDFSFQNPETDTVALDKNSEPIVINGDILRRPSGHGALLDNLNNIGGDIVYIKNIDNLPRCTEDNCPTRYKKLLVGKLVSIQKKIFYMINLLSESVEEEIINAGENFLQNELMISLRNSYYSYSANLKKKYLLKFLNRPVRVCGMIKNSGDPGGGPFWVKDAEGNISLQIVEQSQFLGEQREIMQNSTHFNPVEIVCGLKDYRGKQFNLMNYRDENSYIVTEKSFEGEPIRVLEQPGLWNGGMSDWNTIFVEIPTSSFAPVKEINDLLKPEHIE